LPAFKNIKKSLAKPKKLLMTGGKIKLNSNRIFSPFEIIQFVQKIHLNFTDFEEGDIVDRIHENSQYILTKVYLNEIEEVPYYIDESLVDEYCKMDPNTMPPVVLGKPYGKNNLFPIIDGGHRITAKIKLKHKKIWAYIPNTT